MTDRCLHTSLLLTAAVPLIAAAAEVLGASHLKFHADRHRVEFTARSAAPWQSGQAVSAPRSEGGPAAGLSSAPPRCPPHLRAGLQK